jgi:hypothetical protein
MFEAIQRPGHCAFGDRGRTESVRGASSDDPAADVRPTGHVDRRAADRRVVGASFLLAHGRVGRVGGAAWETVELIHGVYPGGPWLAVAISNDPGNAVGVRSLRS